MMTAEQNKAIFLRFIDELRRGNLAIIDEVCSPEFAFHSPNWQNGREESRVRGNWRRMAASSTAMCTPQSTISLPKMTESRSGGRLPALGSGLSVPDLRRLA